MKEFPEAVDLGLETMVCNLYTVERVLEGGKTDHEHRRTIQGRILRKAR